MSEGYTEISMELIVNAGNSKSLAMEAISEAKNSNFEEANAKLKEARTFLSKAHNAQTSLLTKEAQGTHVEPNLLLIHAQDHLMNSITTIDLATEMVDMMKMMKEEKVRDY